MTFDEFCRTHTEVWDRYLSRVYSTTAKGKVKLGEGMLLFPNVVLYTETEEHYLAELFGASEKYRRLVPRRHKESSVLKYLYQFADTEGNPLFAMNARNWSLKSLLLSRDIDTNRVKERFGFDPYEAYPIRLRMTKEGGCLVSFGPEFESCYFDNCLLVNTWEQIYRVKPILNLTVVSKRLAVSDFLEDMKSKHVWPVQTTQDLVGVSYCPSRSAWAHILSGQFANLFLVPSLGERNIGKFLHENPDFVRYALNCVDFLREQRLEWQEGNLDSDQKYIQPDLLLKRPDGYWDICDLKRPMLDKAKITKGAQSRRRFIDYVQEGVAQLANYEHFFGFQANAAYARKKFQVQVDNPRLILVVGNYENVDISQVREAARMLKQNYAIIDYDTLNASFLLRASSR